MSMQKEVLRKQPASFASEAFTLNTPAEMIVVIEAYANGINLESIGGEFDDWQEVRGDIEPNQLFDFKRCAYRIK